MDSAKLNDWLQVVGLFGVIASLLFVGLQMKQDREIALASIYQSRTEATVDLLVARAAEKDVVRSIVKERFELDPNGPTVTETPGMPNTVQPLTPMELVARVMSENASWMVWDNSHFQYQQGFLPESHWIRVRNLIKTTMRDQPITRWVFELDPEIHRPDIRDVVFDLMNEIDAEAE